MSDGKLPTGFTPISPDSDFGKMVEKFKGFDFSRTNFLANSIADTMGEHNRELERSIRAVQQEQERKEANEEAYRQETIRSLHAIEQNTANLYTLVDLISKSTEQQDEIIAIIADIYSIAKAKTQEEAKSSFQKVMGRISQTVKDVETLGKIATFALTVWNLVQPIIEKLPS